MNVPTTIDAGAWLSKHLEGADGDTDLARSMLGSFAEAIMSPGLDAVQRWLRRTLGRSRELTQRISHPTLGHESRHDRPGHSQTAPRGLQPRGSPQPAPALRAGVGGGDLPGLRRGGLHPSRRRPRQSHGHRG